MDLEPKVLMRTLYYESILTRDASSMVSLDDECVTEIGRLVYFARFARVLGDEEGVAPFVFW